MYVAVSALYLGSVDTVAHLVAHGDNVVVCAVMAWSSCMCMPRTRLAIVL